MKNCHIFWFLHLASITAKRNFFLCGTGFEMCFSISKRVVWSGSVSKISVFFLKDRKHVLTINVLVWISIHVQEPKVPHQDLFYIALNIAEITINFVVFNSVVFQHTLCFQHTGLLMFVCNHSHKLPSLIPLLSKQTSTVFSSSG